MCYARSTANFGKCSNSCIKKTCILQNKICMLFKTLFWVLFYFFYPPCERKWACNVLVLMGMWGLTQNLFWGGTLWHYHITNAHLLNRTLSRCRRWVIVHLFTSLPQLWYTHNFHDFPLCLCFLSFIQRSFILLFCYFSPQPPRMAGAWLFCVQSPPQISVMGVIPSCRPHRSLNGPLGVVD